MVSVHLNVYKWKLISNQEFLTGLADKKGRHDLTLDRYSISQCHFSGHV